MLPRTAATLLVLLPFLGPPSAPAQGPEPAALRPRAVQAIDRAVREEMERQRIVGVAVGVIRRGQVVYLRGYGHEDLEHEIPVTRDTLFRWASISKPLTAIAALQLAEQGKLDLDADVRRYVPEFPDKGEVITARQLLGHLGGIVHYGNGEVVRTERPYDVPHPFEDVVLALDQFKDSPLVCKPGEKFSYTTHGYMLLSAAVERAGGRRFADQVRERIVEPLGLETLQPDYPWVGLPHRAVGYRRQGDGFARGGDTDVSWKLGGAGYISNIDDLAHFAAALVSRRLVSEATEDVMWTSQTTADGKPTGYGLGFAVETDRRGRLKVSHSGAQEKTRTYMVLYPRARYGLVVMSNSEDADPARIARAVFAALGSLARRPAPGS